MPTATWTPYNRIGRPLEAHSARDPQAYLERQARHIADMKIARPDLAWRDPFLSEERPLPFISGGRWVVMCGCGNAPSYDPDWMLALCFECGAAYQQLAPPAGWRQAEAMLMARPEMKMRHWIATESLDELVAETIAHGHLAFHRAEVG
jgi:hypothetical protein